MKMKAKILKIVSIICAFIIFLPVFQVAACTSKNQKTLFRDENEIRFSTEITGEVAEDIEILGVRVLTHVKSGNVAYEPTDSNSTNEEIGALLNIYIKNKTDKDIYPSVLFDGKTASEYIKTIPQQISWANTPDTRTDRYFDKEGIHAEELSNFIPLTEYIPAGAIDCYSINVTDGNLLYNGLEMEISANGKSGKAMLYGDNQAVEVQRIQWDTTYDSKCYPNVADICINNNSSYETTVNYIKLHNGTDNYWLHYWKDSVDAPAELPCTISPNQPEYLHIKFDDIVQFRENLIEINVTNNGRTYSIFEKTRPIIHDFDISVGWAAGDLEKTSYIKAISSMHFNTVIGAFGSSYYLRDEAFREQYPIKIFGYNEGGNVGNEMVIENGVVTVYALDDIHAALPFGEPQLTDSQENQQPMRVFNKLATYRNSPYATNITLTHEPAFYRFAGLSDMVHYDAYRVVAPFSDAWYLYLNYVLDRKYALYWGAPLETMGDYVRTLSKLNNPNPIAAWTQGANTWNTFPRFTKETKYMRSPNEYELRIQAYENVANGANSLYWFNVNGEDLLYHKDTSLEMMYVNRELCTAEDLLAVQVPYYYERTGTFDKNVNITPDSALIFINDINYKVKDSMYQYSGSSGNQEFTFEIPDYLSDSSQLVKITKNGVQKIEDFETNNNTLVFTDSVDMTAFYVLGNDETYEKMQNNYNETVAKETFNIYENDEYYDELQTEFGYSDENPCIPEKNRELTEGADGFFYKILRVVVVMLETLSFYSV